MSEEFWKTIDPLLAPVPAPAAQNDWGASFDAPLIGSKVIDYCENDDLRAFGQTHQPAQAAFDEPPPCTRVGLAQSVQPHNDGFDQ